MIQRPLRIGTRGSPMALAQTGMVRDKIVAANPGLETELVVVTTVADKILDRPLSEIGGKGLFTKELEQALFADAVDVAVHSMKDVETWLPEGLVIACILARDDPRDAFLSPRAAGFADLPEGARVGTSSLRRGGAGADAPAGSAHRAAARQRQHPDAQARGRRMRRDAAGARRPRTPRPRGHGPLGAVGRRDAAGGRARRARHRGPRGRRGRPRPARAPGLCPHHHRGRRRARAARRTRRILPHADRRARADRGRHAEPRRSPVPARRQPPLGRRALRAGRRRGAHRARLRRRDQGGGGRDLHASTCSRPPSLPSPLCGGGWPAS